MPEKVDALCAGAKPPQNGLEERLDMIAAQLSLVVIELHKLNERSHDGPTD